MALNDGYACGVLNYIARMHFVIIYYEHRCNRHTYMAQWNGGP